MAIAGVPRREGGRPGRRSVGRILVDTGGARAGSAHSDTRAGIAKVCARRWALLRRDAVLVGGTARRGCRRGAGIIGVAIAAVVVVVCGRRGGRVGRVCGVHCVAVVVLFVFVGGRGVVDGEAARRGRARRGIYGVVVVGVVGVFS